MGSMQETLLVLGEYKISDQKLRQPYVACRKEELPRSGGKNKHS